MCRKSKGGPIDFDPVKEARSVEADEGNQRKSLSAH